MKNQKVFNQEVADFTTAVLDAMRGAEAAADFAAEISAAMGGAEMVDPLLQGLARVAEREYVNFQSACRHIAETLSTGEIPKVVAAHQHLRGVLQIFGLCLAKPSALRRRGGVNSPVV